MSIPKGVNSESPVPRLPLEALKSPSEAKTPLASEIRETSTPGSAAEFDKKVSQVSQKVIEKTQVVQTPPLKVPELHPLDLHAVKSLFQSSSNKISLGYRLIELLITPAVKLPSMVTGILKRCPDEGSRQVRIRSSVYPLISNFPDKSTRMRILGVAEQLIDPSETMGITIQQAQDKLANLFEK